MYLYTYNHGIETLFSLLQQLVRVLYIGSTGTTFSNTPQTTFQIPLRQQVEVAGGCNVDAAAVRESLRVGVVGVCVVACGVRVVAHGEYVAVCCSVLQHVAVCCSVLQYVAVCCSVLQCVAVYYSMLQCVAVRYSVLQGVQYVAVCGSALQYGAVCCSELQYVTAWGSLLQYVAVCYSVLYPVASV